MDSKKLLASALILASTQVAHAGGPKAGKIKCYGVVEKGQGECGGKTKVNGKEVSWPCGGYAPTVESTWVSKTKKECTALGGGVGKQKKS